MSLWQFRTAVDGWLAAHAPDAADDLTDTDIADLSAALDAAG
jgi:hypothetical protein